MTPVLLAAAMDVSLWIFVTAACLFSCFVGSACTYYAVNWSRDRQEEADQARRENAIEHGMKLAQENQKLEERISGDAPQVELYDQANEPDYAGWAAGIRLDPTVEHLGQACGWSEDGTADCGDPAEGWATWPDGEVVWLCATHFQWVRQSEDDPADTLPRVLPEGRVSD